MKEMMKNLLVVVSVFSVLALGIWTVEEIRYLQYQQEIDQEVELLRINEGHLVEEAIYQCPEAI